MDGINIHALVIYVFYESYSALCNSRTLALLCISIHIYVYLYAYFKAYFLEFRQQLVSRVSE